MYMVMHYVSGESLGQRLRREHRLPHGDTRAILCDVAAALDYAHRQGVVHRDLKPENVLLEREDHHALLADFGVATRRSWDPVRDELHRAFGTPHFMSPEQAMGEVDLDGRSDIYGLGVLGFLMLSGRLPFIGVTFEEIAAKHLNERAPSLARLAPGTPREVFAAIERCMAKDPCDRWGHASELRDAFIGVISHELRTPITTIYGLARILRQRGDALDPVARADALADIEAESDRLYRLVEDLLVLSRAESGAVAIEPEPINLARLVGHIVEAEQQRRPDRHFVVTAPGYLPLIEAEATYVEQVVRNLLTNAAKYSEPPSDIDIELSVGEADVVVRVLDRGIGVDEEASAHAFELFYRTKEASRTASGAGIGLFVCRQLVEAIFAEHPPNPSNARIVGVGRE